AEQTHLIRQEQALERTSAGAPAHPRSELDGYSGTSETRSEGVGLRAEKEKREYESLFASNVALTFRRESPVAAKESAPQGDDEWSKMVSFYSALAALQGSSPRALASISPAPTPASSSPLGRAAQPDSTAGALDAAKPVAETPRKEKKARQAQGKEHRLFEGTVIETGLTNRLDGSFSGPVNC